MNSTKYFFSCVFCLSLYLLRSEETPQQTETVKLSLYYESLCPFCDEFIAKHLYPGYKPLKDYLTVDLVPYGFCNRSQVHKRWHFECSHGPKECLGNRIQACVVGKNYTQDQKVAFSGCTMSKDPSSIKDAKTCAAKLGLLWIDVQKCLQTEESDLLLVHFGEVTDGLQPKLPYVPNIRFNDVYDKDLERRARRDFVGAVCSLLKVKPSICNQ